MCKFFVRTGGKNTECHFDPPKAFLIPGLMNKISGDPAFQIMGCWPPTKPSSECGKFETKLIPGPREVMN